MPSNASPAPTPTRTTPTTPHSARPRTTADCRRKVLEDLGGASRGQGVSLSRRGLCMLAASLGAICASSPRAHALAHSGLGAVPPGPARRLWRSRSGARARLLLAPGIRPRCDLGLPLVERREGALRALNSRSTVSHSLRRPSNTYEHRRTSSPLRRAFRHIPATEATPPSSPSQIGMQALVAGATTRESGWGLPEASVPPAA